MSQIQLPRSTRDVPLSLKLTIALVGAMAFLQVFSVQTILPAMTEELHLSVIEASRIVSATVFGVALMSPFIGIISDAIGRRNVIISACFFSVIPVVAMGFTDSLTSIVIARFFQGVATPAMAVVVVAYVGEDFTHDARTQLMSFYVSGTVFGGFSGRFLIGYFTEYFGWHNAFILMGLMSLLGAFLTWYVLPPSRNFHPNRNVKRSWAMIRIHLKNKALLAACCLGFCVLFSLVSTFTFINYHLTDAPYLLSEADLANIFFVYLIGMLITPISAFVLMRIGPNNTVILSILLSIAGVALTFVHPLWGIVVALALMCSGVFMTQASTITYISIYVQRGRSLASGMYYSAYYIGGTIGATVCGIAYEHGQWLWSAACIIAVQLIGIAIASTLMRVKKNPIRVIASSKGKTS